MHLIQVTIYMVDDRMTRSAADCRWHSSLFTYSKEGGGRAAKLRFKYGYECIAGVLVHV